MKLRISAAWAVALAGSVLLAAAVPGCGGGGARPQQPSPQPERIRPAAAVAPMDLGGQKVLVLPVQQTSGLNVTREQATAEVVFALGERDARTQWVFPDQLRAALRRAPGYADDPATLPHDLFMHHGERYIIDPLASVVRRYSALVDARLVVIPREARFLQAPDSAAVRGVVRMSAVMVDARTGNVIWYGEADGPPSPLPDQAAVAAAAAALAARMVAPSER